MSVFYYLKQLLICVCLIILPQLATAGYSHNVYTLTFAILSYTKWNSTVPTICVLEDAAVFQNFKQQMKYTNYAYNIVLINEGDLKTQHCDAIFLSTNKSITQQNNILRSNFQPFTLSLTNNNTECEGQVIFCLYQRKDFYTFNVNLDALSHSKLHIDPRVLLLAKNME
ncbi:YfiR family protein [Acinetobacter sp. B5B]|uniref:YfiR family protein n=1 Tax=Acinetobacter baretiae TaxID=2605383 RepID=UPI0018C202B4|nr:YfiR family protein [Acinetobacter baretiae]MBF7682361.1 YfiR family protein [Acinetobacter baretiae]MBF7685189.1 YfiR family protein [Acinetobacter baretiae]